MGKVCVKRHSFKLKRIYAVEVHNEEGSETETGVKILLMDGTERFLVNSP